MQLSFAVFFAWVATSTVAAPTSNSSSSTSALKVSLSRRSNPLLQDGSNQIDWQKMTAHLDHLKHKYESTLQNYERNVGEKNPLDRLTTVPKRRGTGEVGLTDQSDELLWTGTMSFGGQTIAFDFDTGSADTLANAGSYSPHKSAKDTGTKFSTSYGDGTMAQGEVYTDDLVVGGLKASNVAIGLSTTKFVSHGSSGIAGMAYPSLAAFNSKYPPFFDTLMNAGVLDSPVFTFKLRKAGSTLTLGKVAASKVSYVDVEQSKGYWSVPASVNAQQFTAIVDTGTTIIVGPRDEVFFFLLGLRGVTPYNQDGILYGIYDCSSPPDVSFSFGDAHIKLGSDTVSFGTTDDGKCVLSVIGQDVGIAGWVTGDVLLRNTVAVFDRGSNRVGFGH